MFKRVRTVKTCTETWESRNLSPDSKAMPDRHWHLNILNYLSKILPRLPSDTNPEKSTLDRTPALVPVFGFSLAFPSFLLLTLGGSRDKPHWTKLSPARHSNILTGRPNSTRSYDMLACRKLSYHDKFHSARVEVPTRWEITRQVCSSLSSTPQNAPRKLGGKLAWPPFN